MNKLIEENIIIIMLVILVIAGGGYGVYNFGTEFSNSKIDLQTKKERLKSLNDEFQRVQDAKRELEERKKQEEQEEAKEVKQAKSGKVIYEVLGQQFSTEASFGIMFENILSNITNSGVKIRSINYNYRPSRDKVMEVNAPGYNACELSFTTVSTYAQLQKFFKNLAKESYLTSIYQVDIEPYDKDKTILIARFKIRLYTRLI